MADNAKKSARRRLTFDDSQDTPQNHEYCDLSGIQPLCSTVSLSEFENRNCNISSQNEGDQNVNKTDKNNGNIQKEKTENLPLFVDLDSVEERLRAIEKWNFDFENEVPLTGDWQWEKIETSHHVEPKPNFSAMRNSEKDHRNV